MESKFINMEPWGDKGDRVVKNNVGEKYSYDLHNNCVLLEIRAEPSSVTFVFEGRGYLPQSINSLQEKRTFELVFHNTNNVTVHPPGLLPLKNKISMDDFLCIPSEKGFSISWFGDTGTAEPDPRIDFHAENIEFRCIPSSK